MSNKPQELTPPDRERCQAQYQGGSFMTLGPRPWTRCESKPGVVVTEKTPDKNGQLGAMSLCDPCLEMFRLKHGLGHVFIERINRE